MGKAAVDILFVPLLRVLSFLLDFYSWVIISGVILHWLVLLQVVDSYHPLISSLLRFYEALTNPIYNRIRHFLPYIGQIDLAPMVLWLMIYFCRIMVERILWRLTF